MRHDFGPVALIRSCYLAAVVQKVMTTFKFATEGYVTSLCFCTRTYRHLRCENLAEIQFLKSIQKKRLRGVLAKGGEQLFPNDLSRPTGLQDSLAGLISDLLDGWFLEWFD